MSWWFWAFAASALFCAAPAVLLWRVRSRAAAALLVVLLALIEWSVADALQHVGWGWTGQLWALRASYLGICTVPVGLYCLSRVVADPTWRLSRRGMALLAIEPLLVQVALATNGAHHLFFTRVVLAGQPPLLEVDFGPAFQVHALYDYLVIGAAGLRCLHLRRTGPPAVRAQVRSLVVGVVAPVVANVVTLASGTELRVDTTALYFTVSAVVWTWAVLRQGAVAVLPAARGHIIETMSDAMVVVDPLGRIVELNRQCRRLLEDAGRAVPLRPVGISAVDVLGDTLAALVAGDRGQAGLTTPDGRHLDVRSSALADRRGRPLGRVIVARDITEAHQARTALEDANRQMAEQLVIIEQLRASLAEEAVRDPLTGLHNRRHLTRQLADALAVCRADGAAADGAAADGVAARGARPVSVIMVDLDHFKAINDTHGHHVGDLALIATAGVLSSSTRDGDTVARYGGEEFVLVLPGVSQEVAAERAELVRRRLAAVRVRAGEQSVSFTASAGVACAPGDGADAEALLGAADAALYAAKAAGRDCVRRAAPAAPPLPLPRSGATGAPRSVQAGEHPR